MISKSNLGKTNKYAGVAKSVQKASPTNTPDEPRITPEQVISAFKSFGFEPNDRNHNDIGYWTMKGQSEGVKLMEELHKRRMDINNAEDEAKKTAEQKKKSQEDLLNKQNEAKTTIPRLSDNEISSLFDEYGLPAPDPEWARNHLPNDPQRIRPILEMQRKMADSMLKKHTTNAVNAIPEVPKNVPMAAPAATPMVPASAGGGMGGPTPLGAQAGMGAEGAPVTPFFIGDHSIVRITNPNNPNSATTWLVDAKKKVLRPFASDEAFKNAFEDPQAAERAVTTISSKDLGPGGALSGFTPLRSDQGVRHDGTMDNIEFSPSELQNRYGKPADQAAENRSMSLLDGIVGNLNKQQ
jgi:hypothetical protein